LAFVGISAMFSVVLTSEFDYPLPPELIAQTPEPQRDQSRLLVLDRDTRQVAHRRFRNLVEYLSPGDVLVLNDSKVIPARLRGRNVRTGGNFEILLVEELADDNWWTMIRPGRRAMPGTKIQILDKQRRPSALEATVVEFNAGGQRRLQFRGPKPVLAELEVLGEIPLPPYIKRPAEQLADRERYQTVYAQAAGSVAAPTAGLHFTRDLLEEIRARGVKTCFVTLHVGLGTFAPVKAEEVSKHIMHHERFTIGADTAETIRAAKESGRRVVAVGTTTLRVLESDAAGKLAAGPGRTNLFVRPPFHFQMVNALVTNFHLPRSSLLMLAAAFAAPGETRGLPLILRAYEEAVARRYRFFSYGDAMLLR
jgi:S-adenosylmethionine:tRNA ribosyltransferase-isomerase